MLHGCPPWENVLLLGKNICPPAGGAPSLPGSGYKTSARHLTRRGPGTRLDVRGIMTTPFRTLTVSALLLISGPALAQGPARLTPLVVDGDRFFRLEWHAADDGRPVVYGSIRNEFGFGAQKVRLLVDSLDAAGAITGQTLVYVQGDLM